MPYYYVYLYIYIYTKWHLLMYRVYWIDHYISIILPLLLIPSWILAIDNQLLKHTTRSSRWGHLQSWPITNNVSLIGLCAQCLWISMATLDCKGAPGEIRTYDPSNLQRVSTACNIETSANGQWATNWCWFPAVFSRKANCPQVQVSI